MMPGPNEEKRSAPSLSLLRPVDVLALGFVAALLALAVAAWMHRIPGAATAAGRLCCSMALIVGLRFAGAIRFARLGALAAALAPIGLVPVDWALNPITDLINPVMRDPALLAIDRALFGETPSIRLQGVLTPAFTELLLLSYVAFFALLLAPPLLLWLRRDDASLESYVRIVVLFFVTNFMLYLAVPAIGPRFVLADRYALPLHGIWLGDSIRDLFLRTPYLRDCFPSGHTAGTLIAVCFTARRIRGYCLAVLPVACLCICATVLCRFHYAIDLLCALPLIGWSFGLERILDANVWSAGLNARSLFPDGSAAAGSAPLR